MALAAWSLLAACGPSAPAKTAPSSPPLHLRPVADLAQAAGLNGIVSARPRELFADPEWTIAVRELFDDARFEAFAERHGGVDLRALDELVITDYPEATLFLAGGVVDPARVEQSFAARARVEGRGVDRRAGPLGTIVRTWGTVHDRRQQLAVLGREAVGLEVGRFGPLRVAELFAQERLKRAHPALRTTPLDRLVGVLGADAPIVALAPGPFDDAWAQALGGLLGASTAAGLSVRRAPASAGDGAMLRVRLALLGTWGEEQREGARERFAAALHVLAESSLGRLCGLNHPRSNPTVRSDGEALIAELTVAARPLFRGLKAATGASVEELMRFGELDRDLPAKPRGAPAPARVGLTATPRRW